jgi:hypothetical protein
MLPWAIAASRGKANQGAVGLINLFLGWTFVGWVVALVMACQAHQIAVGGSTIVFAQQFASEQPTAPPGWYPVATGGRRYWDGTRWSDYFAP